MEANQSSGNSFQSQEGASNQATETAQEAQGPDINAIMADLETEKASRQKLESEHRKTSETLGKIQKAFGDGGEDAPDPDSSSRQFLDQYLQAALEGEKAGKPIPLTAGLAVKFVDIEKENRALKKDLHEVMQIVKMLKDPSTTYDNTAYANFDKEIQNALHTIYGEDDSDFIEVVTKKASRELAKTRKENPALWDKIRRDGNLQRNIAMHYVEKLIPPSARKMLQADKVRNTPMTRSDLMQAFKEADEQYKDNPEVRSNIKAKIRQEILGDMLQFKNRR